jgi:hypothetical protein
MIDAMSAQLRLYLEGPDLPDPAHLGLGELARLLEKLNRVITAFAEEIEIAAQLVEPSEQLASLVGIEKGSVELVIRPAPLLPLEERLIAPVLQGDWGALPPNTYDWLYELSKELMTKDRSLKVALRDKSVPVPWIGAERPVPKRRAALTIEDTITLYGRVIRLGGVTPKVDLRVGNEEYHVEADSELIKNLERQGALYKIIGLKATGTFRLEGKIWKVDSGSLRLVEILPYTESNMADAFHRLASLTGEYWRGVDVEEYMKKIRG